MPSARVLRDAIEELTGIHYLITTRDNFAPTALLRYGSNIRPINGDTDNNSIERINLLSNKLSFSRLVTETNLSTPAFFTSMGTLVEFPVIVRDTLTGFGGRGIHVCTNMDEFRAAMHPGCYWTPFIKMSTEYRVHVAGGKILRVFEKVREDGQPEEAYPIRNNDRGYHFSLVNRPRHGESIRAAVAELSRVSIMSTGFYALDLGWEPENKRIIVIEGNSAPGLNEITARCYARYILGMEQESVVSEVAPARAETQTVPATARPTTLPEREPNDILRTTPHNPGTGDVNPTAQTRIEHKHPVERAKWEW